MMRRYWILVSGLCFGLLFGGCRKAPVATETVAKEQSTPNAPQTKPAPSVEIRIEHLTARMPRDRDGRPIASALPDIKNESASVSAPREIVDFNEWMRRYASANPARRGELIDEGRSLVAARRQVMAGLIATNPRAAVMTSPSLAQRADLPAEISDQLEQIVSGEGFYGVKAICEHDPGVGHAAGCRIEHDAVLEGVVYKAFIYGDRKGRLTEENASLYGVVLDGLIALHEDDWVVMPASEVEANPAHAGQLAVIYKGRTTYAANEEALPAHIKTLLAP